MDIVERLRAAMSQMDAYDRFGRQKLDDEAADEIVRLQAVVTRLHRERREWKAVLKSLLHDPPATLDEPDTDAEVIIKMRAIVRAALSTKDAAE